MNWDEYNILFHKHNLNLVAFKRLMECDHEVLKLVNAALDEVSLQMVSGGAAPEGYLGKVTLLIGGEYVDYVKAQPPLPVQPVQEPVAWRVEPLDDLAKIFNSKNQHVATVYAAEAKRIVDSINTAQPRQREWVGLTDDEVYKIAFEYEGEHWRKIADAIEDKLKEKNK
jgi:hypothetical protein